MSLLKLGNGISSTPDVTVYLLRKVEKRKTKCKMGRKVRGEYLY